MAAEVLVESYVMATGYAALMGANAEQQHLFARNYDRPVTIDVLKQHWAENAARNAERGAKDEGFYLIHLGYDIVSCPGDWDTALKHLAHIRGDFVEQHRQATGRDPERVPWLIGVYPPHTIGGPEGKGGVYSFGYEATLHGQIDVPRNQWQRVTL
jgi:hypothetical protein